MKNRTYSHFWVPIIASLLAHSFIFSVAENLGQLIPDSFIEKSESPRLIEVSTIPKNQITYRTVGEQNGSDAFSLPQNGQNNIFNQLQTPGHQTKKLSALQVKPVTPNKNQFVQSKNTSAIKKDQINTRLSAVSKERLEREMIQEDLQDLGIISPRDQGPINFNNLSIGIKPPKGVKEDELNKIEQVFYGFQKRIYVTYINSLRRTYQDFLTKYPVSEFKSIRGNQTLVGRAIYDRNGNVKSIKILKWSDNTLIQDFFETSLTNINAIPNPPEQILEDEEDFTIYYKLLINS